MDFPLMLCVCSAIAPFVAIAREVWLNRRPWFSWCLVIGACVFAVMVSLLYFYISAADALCYNYESVVDRLWKCSGMDYSWENTCCHDVEDEVSAGCGWDYSRAEFCSQFAEATAEYCRIGYCPPFDRNVTIALPPVGQQPGLAMDS
ncbi:unnamed protein product [Calypogeia fissa]